jgi:hypothetical protein
MLLVKGEKSLAQACEIERAHGRISGARWRANANSATLHGIRVFAG